VFKREERARQRAKWGDEDHDDHHNAWDWIAFITKQLGRAVKPGDGGGPEDARKYRYQMVRVAALAVAAIEWIDRRGGSESD